MPRIHIEIPRNKPVEVKISLVDGLVIPRIKMTERIARLPFVGSFLIKNIESLRHTLGGNYEDLPDEINRIRWGIIDGGFTDQEVYNEVKQTLRLASGDSESKSRIGQHVTELLLPLAA